MRKFFRAAMLALPLFLFAGCDVSSMGSLSELTKPYAGLYECTVLTLGGEDLLPKFGKITLGLGAEEFVLTVSPVSGEEGELSGTYAVSPEGDEVIFRIRKGGHTFVRSCRREQGAIVFDENAGGRLLHAEFRFP